MIVTEDKVVIQSQIDNLCRYLLIVGFLFFGWMCYLTRSAVYQEPMDLIFLIIFLIFAGFALWSLIGFWTYFDSIKIFPDRLEIKNFGGLYKKTILFSEIGETETKNKKGKYNSWDELIIRYNSNKKYKIYSTSYKNYNEIDRFISSKRGRSIKRVLTIKDKSQNIEAIIVASILAICLYGIYYFYQQSNEYQLDKNKVVSIELTLDNKPSIVNSSKGRKWLSMSVKEYPDFRFNISGVAYSATSVSNFIENTEGGSRIVLTIDKEDYLQKLAKSKEATFWKKHFNYRNISIYEIKDSSQAYLTISSYEEENKSDSKWGVLGIIGFLVYLSYVAFSEQNKKKKS